MCMCVRSARAWGGGEGDYCDVISHCTPTLPKTLRRLPVACHLPSSPPIGTVAAALVFLCNRRNSVLAGRDHACTLASW